LLAKYKEAQLDPKVAAVKVSADEIKAAYEKDLARYTQPAKVKLAILFIEAGLHADTNRVAAAEARAKEVVAGAATLPPDARGFGKLAADFSDDQVTRYRGGDAGWFAADSIIGRWPAEVLAAGFALKNNGDLSGVLHASDGFYVVKKLDSRPSTVTPLEQVRPVIERRLLFAGQQSAELQFKLQARQAAKVSTNAGLLAAVFYPTQNQASSKLFNPAALPAAN
jgi:parvulin-like peptidyl-prolyl isomerase